MEEPLMNPSHFLHYVNYRLWGKRYKYLLRYLYKKHQPTYYTVIEHPKCGRTWLRYMISQAEAISLNVPLTNTIYDIIYLNKQLPRVFYVHGFKPEIPLVHFNYLKHFEEGLTPKGMIFLIRSPLTMLVSYYYQLLYRKKNDFSGTFSDLIRDKHYGIHKYISYVDFYWNNLQNYHYLLIKYESLLHDTKNQLSAVLKFIELPLPLEQVSQIVNNSTFEKMRTIEKTERYKVQWLRPADKKNENSFKTRSMGKPNHMAHYSKDDLEYVKSACKGTVIEKFYPEII